MLRQVQVFCMFSPWSKRVSTANLRTRILAGRCTHENPRVEEFGGKMPRRRALFQDAGSSAFGCHAKYGQSPY